MLKITDDNFDDTVLRAENKFLLEFGADRCYYCNVMKDVIEDAAEELNDVTFGIIDVDAENRIPDLYSIRSIPTMILFKNGEVVARKSGVISRDEMERMIGGTA